MTATILDVRPANWATVEAAQAGDMDAFADIYRTHHAAVLRFVTWRIWNRHTAEEITAEVFVKALRHIGTVSWQGRDIGAWLTTLARNLIVDRLKSAEQQRTSPVGAVTDDHTPRRGGSGWNPPDLDEQVASAAVHDIVRTAVTALTDDQQRCIELRFYRELTVAETAAAMGLSAGAVKSLQYRAVRALRTALDGLEVAP